MGRLQLVRSGIAAVVAVLGCVVGVAQPASAGGSTWKFDADHYEPGRHASAWAPVSWEHSETLGTPDDGPYFAYVSRRSTEAVAEAAIPPDAVRVGQLRISLDPYDAGGVLFGPHYATIDFTVPDLSDGEYSLWHCNSPCTTTLGDITFGTFTIGPVASPPSPPGPASAGRWTLIPKDTAGLGESASFRALTSSRDALLLAGEQPTGDSGWLATIWRSPDGVRWTQSTHPLTIGTVDAIAVDGDTALAIGGSGFGISNFVWRSEDAGLTWTVVAKGNDVFGTAAPQMGRPNVSGLIRHRGWWVASGGRSDGYAAIWVSRDGADWSQVLGANPAGAATIVKGRGESLLAHWGSIAWFAHDPTNWGTPQTVSVPDRFFLNSVAPGATTAVGDNVDRHGQPTPLWRSTDRGHTWTEDKRFLTQFPNASVWTVTRTGTHWIAAGWSDGHVDAWISTDRRRWKSLPEELYGGAGGTLSLVAAVDRRIVLLGTAPELDRYYAYEPASHP